MHEYVHTLSGQFMITILLPNRREVTGPLAVGLNAIIVIQPLCNEIREIETSSENYINHYFFEIKIVFLPNPPNETSICPPSSGSSSMSIFSMKTEIFPFWNWI
jgi:hypothetical protein